MIDLKEQGNALYKDGDYLKAAAAYSKAIKQDPNNHVLFRYACHLSDLPIRGALCGL
jgi:tetratricopeptide (TPR) repeat protein